MTDIAEWLRYLGLERYARQFAENHIDLDTLRELSEIDLKDLGVASLGHRRKLLAAIVKLDGPPTGLASAGGVGYALSVAERRQISVLVADLAGSTALSTRLDPEDLRSLLQAYHRTCAEAIERHGGRVAQFQGDAVLAFFGDVRAAEDDSERAVRAGLAIVELVAGLDIGEKLHCRVGIATGLVITAALGVGAAQQRNALGETPNLAARIQSLAPLDTLVIDSATQRMIANLFEYRDLGTFEARGFDAPVRLYAVLKPSTVESRFEATRGASLTPLVGREEVLARMLAAWEEARQAHGQIVVLEGEAGIGKSRLAAIAQQRIARDPHVRLRYFCSPHHQDSPLYPFVSQLGRTAGFERDDGPEEKITKLERALEPCGSREELALIADFLSLPPHESLPKLSLTPEARRARTLAALMRQLDLLSLRAPLLMICEDLQWADSTSLELLERIVDAVPNLPVLLIVTVRGELAARWVDAPHVEVLRLAALKRDDSARLVKSLAGSALSPEIVDDIVERTDGVPLFLEEVTRAVIESGPRGEPLQALVARIPPAPSRVPPALHASLMARLDSLGPAKEIAQIGAAIAREFSYELLSKVADKNEADLSAGLERLISAGLLTERGTPPNATYLFKHALVQDAAYGAMLRETRRALHSRIADAIPSIFPEIASAQPHLVAHHLTEAGTADEAADYWLKAAQHALSCSALVEAIAHVERGIALVGQLPETERRNHRELELQLALGKALIATKGYTVPATIACFARARHLCEILGDPPQVVSVLHGQWTQALMRNELGIAQERAREIRSVGEARNDAFWKWMGDRLAGVTCFPLGDFIGARDHFERGLTRYAEAHRSISGDNESGVVTRLTLAEGQIVIMTYLSWVLLYLGRIDEARQLRGDAVQEARKTSLVYPLAHALNGLVFTELTLNAPRSALAYIDELSALTQQHQIAYYAAIKDVFHGWCLAKLGEPNNGIPLLAKGLSSYRATGTVVYVPTFLRLFAEAHYCAGDIEKGLDLIEESLQMVEGADARVDEAETYRMRGMLFLKRGNRSEAEKNFERALAVAGRQEARLIELRAAVELARLWRDAGRHADARRLVEPLCAGFREGLDIADLSDARALLARLA